ncbi:MAG: DUF3027 domain-containing protein [Propionibacteriaceae bacterium]
MATTKMSKIDPALRDAVDIARAAAEEAASIFGVGEYLEVTAEASRVATHWFTCPHSGYVGWRWAVTVTRAARAKTVTVDEVVLLPSSQALIAPAWIPYADRIQAGDIAPGVVMPTADDDPRLEPGFTGGDIAPDTEPAQASIIRSVVAELGLGRERVLSDTGRVQAAERWFAGEGGPDNQMTKLAPGICVDCGYFIRLQGRLGALFGACGNAFSPSDGRVTSVDHGCGAHSDVVSEEQSIELGAPAWDTISLDNSLFS